MDTLKSNRPGVEELDGYKYRRGNTAPADALIDKYSHTVCTLGAIEAQLEGKSYHQAAIDLGRNPKTFPRYMKRAAQMLAAAYA